MPGRWFSRAHSVDLDAAAAHAVRQSPISNEVKVASVQARVASAFEVAIARPDIIDALMQNPHARIEADASLKDEIEITRALEIEHPKVLETIKGVAARGSADRFESISHFIAADIVVGTFSNPEAFRS